MLSIVKDNSTTMVNCHNRVVLNMCARYIRALLVIGLYAVGNLAHAQEYDGRVRVTLKNGTVYDAFVGKIDIQGKVGLVLTDGTIRVWPMDSVHEILRPEWYSPHSLSDSSDIAPLLLTTDSKRKVFRKPEKHSTFYRIVLNPSYRTFGFGSTVGYRFGKGHELGAGFLFDFIGRSVSFLPSRHNGRQNQIEGFSIPLFVQYGGQLRGNRVLPVYQMELGYAFNAALLSDHVFRPQGPGGYHVAASAGIRILSPNRYNLTLGLRASVRGYEMKFREYTIDPDKGILRMEDNLRQFGALFLGISITHSFN